MAWDKANTKQVSEKDKTKKNVAFETTLFSLVFAGFACFNLYYWSSKRAVFEQEATEWTKCFGHNIKAYYFDKCNRIYMYLISYKIKIV